MPEAKRCARTAVGHAPMMMMMMFFINLWDYTLGMA